ncbi:hypothetical protein CYMTET_21940 [Cymbomonas tetramitiformis]|uniref:Receptor ligand binding region domain-containing protein n=1 Tax=Cymbomonas tetramitiformis TaxID=36881 RepID=A0AAE0L2H3_9CHLO|nr:hypothetical protein CYMTET_21940 [Cymbomonas tetramitiformis]
MPCESSGPEIGFEDGGVEKRRAGGCSGIEAFHDQAALHGIYIVASFTYALGAAEFTDVVKGLGQSRALIIVTFGTAEDTARLMEESYDAGVGGGGYVWIGSEATVGYLLWENLSPQRSEAERNDILRGFLAVTPYVNQAAPEFRAFAERFRARPATIDESAEWCDPQEDGVGTPLWMRHDSDDNLTTYDTCVGLNHSRSDLPTGAVAIWYDAVYVVARALHNLLPRLDLGQSGSVVAGAQLLNEMLNQSFVGASGQIAFDSAGDRATGLTYEVVNHAGGTAFHGVGFWSPEISYQECVEGSSDCWLVLWSTGRVPCRTPAARLDAADETTISFHRNWSRARS